MGCGSHKSVEVPVKTEIKQESKQFFLIYSYFRLNYRKSERNFD